MKAYTILSEATFVALYPVTYPEEAYTDQVPVTERHLVYVTVPAEDYPTAVARVKTEGIIDTLFTIADLGAIKGTQQVASYASDVASDLSIEQVTKVLGILESQEPFTLQDSQPVVPVICGYDLE